MVVWACREDRSRSEAAVMMAAGEVRRRRPPRGSGGRRWGCSSGRGSGEDRRDGLNCSKDSSFDITCNYSTNPPKAFIRTGNLQVYDISNSELRISNLLAYKCYNSGEVTRGQNMSASLGAPFMYSEANVLTVVGCDDYANLFSSPGGHLPKGCITTCQDTDEVPDNECSGSGCCQVSINLQQFFVLGLGSYYNHSNVSSFSSCGYAFFGEKSSFNFKGISDLKDPEFLDRTTASVPIVLDWVIGNKSCTEVYQDSNSKACGQENTYCINGTRSVGYRCSCEDGYEGNPYLSPGCKVQFEVKERGKETFILRADFDDFEYNSFGAHLLSFNIEDKISKFDLYVDEVMGSDNALKAIEGLDEMIYQDKRLAVHLKLHFIERLVKILQESGRPFKTLQESDSVSRQHSAFINHSAFILSHANIDTYGSIIREKAIPVLVHLLHIKSSFIDLPVVFTLSRFASISPDYVSVILDQGALDYMYDIAVRMDKGSRLMENLAKFMAVICLVKILAHEECRQCIAILDKIFLWGVGFYVHMVRACYALQFLSYERHVEIQQGTINHVTQLS